MGNEHNNAEMQRIDISNASHLAYVRLKEAIITHRFKPGEQLSLRTVASQMGVSTTPLNQAIGRLSDEGLIKIVPRVGTFVADLTPDEVRQLFEAREAIEMYTVRLAARQATVDDILALSAILADWEAELAHLSDSDSPMQASNLFEKDSQFHRRIVEISGNRYLAEEYRRIDAQLWAFVRMKLSRFSIDVQRAAKRGHEQVMDALRARDEDTCALAIRDHIREMHGLYANLISS